MGATNRLGWDSVWGALGAVPALLGLSWLARVPGSERGDAAWVAALVVVTAAGLSLCRRRVLPGALAVGAILAGYATMVAHKKRVLIECCDCGAWYALNFSPPLLALAGVGAAAIALVVLALRYQPLVSTVHAPRSHVAAPGSEADSS